MTHPTLIAASPPGCASPVAAALGRGGEKSTIDVSLGELPNERF